MASCVLAVLWDVERDVERDNDVNMFEEVVGGLRRLSL